jgi:hypothetical protein
MKFAKSLFLFLAVVFIFNGSAFAGVFATQTISQDFQPEGIVLGRHLNKENAVSLGQASFKAAMTVSERYDDNIFLTPNSKKSDYITEVNPQIFMDLPFGIDERHAFQVLYDAKLAENPPVWLTTGNSKITLSYSSDINLKRLEARLRSRWFSVSAIERDLYTNPVYSVEQRIVARLETILLRVEEILAMYPASMELKIKILSDRRELSREYLALFGTAQNYKSFYIHSLRTIYASMQDISDSVIAHEMAHAVIDNYFLVIPPEKTAELLATYVDSHLERE